MSKIIRFDNGVKSLSALAEKRREEGDLIGAVSAYRSALAKSPFDYGANAGLAELYGDVDLGIEAINCWFRALSRAEDDFERARAYNGLGANYYILGKDSLAMNYFGKQLETDNESDFEYNDVLDNMREEFFEDPPEQYSVVYDKKKKGREALEKARNLLDTGRPDEALKKLSEVSPEDDAFSEALEIIAFILLLRGEYQVAYETASRAVSLRDGGLLGNCALCSALFHLERKEESLEAFKKIVSTGMATETQDFLQVSMVAIEIGQEEAALDFINRILEDTPYNLNVLYVRGLIKYNLGDEEGCREDMKTVLTFTENAVARQRLLETRLEKDKRPERFAYEFDLTESEVKFRLDELNKKFLSLKGGHITFADIREHCECIVKCRFPDLFTVGMHMGLAVDAAGMQEYLKEVLLDVTVDDDIKRAVVKEYLSLGLKMPIKLVTGHYYKEFTIEPIEMNGYAAELFIEVYNALAASLYTVGASKKVGLLRRRIKKYREIFTDNGGLDSASPEPIAAAVLYKMKIDLLSSEQVAQAMFGVSEREFEAALETITERK